MGPGNGSWLVDSRFLASGQTAYTLMLLQIVSSVNREKQFGPRKWFVIGLDSRPVGHTSHTLVVMSNCLHRTCVNRYNILGPSKTVRDWWIEEFGPVDKINVSRMWIGWILLGLENNGLWLVEHSFSASEENRIHTHVTKQWPAVWIGNCFFGPCVIGRLWLLGHWTTKKNIGNQKFDWRFFSVSTVSLRILDIRIYCSFDILGFRRFFQIYLFNENLHKRRACCDERASEPLFVSSSSVVAAGLVVFRFRRFHVRLSSAASDDEEETRNFWRILRRKKNLFVHVFFFKFDEQRWRSGSEESCSSAEASVRLFVRR
jgi:hypothetical protein